MARTDMPSPFLGYVGGKSNFLRIFRKYYPLRFETYYEPFLGSGAVFFHLVRLNLIRRAVISDIEKDLIDCYITIRDNVDELLSHLHKIRLHLNEKGFFYTARKRFNELQSCGSESVPEKSALFIYLNRTCFNSRMRKNRRGELGVGPNTGKRHGPFNKNNILAVSRTLNREGVEILCCDYRDALKNAGRGDFVYLDPPYFLSEKKNDYYFRGGFTLEDQLKVAETCRELDSRGCMIMMSNSTRSLDLYPGFRIFQLKVYYPTKCSREVEILALNYKASCDSPLLSFI